LQTQGNAWTAFLRRLAIQFSKTEQNPSTERTASNRALTTAVSRGLRAGFRMGRRIYLSRPASSRGMSKRKAGPPFDRRDLISTSGLFIPSSNSLRLSRHRAACEGRCFYPSPGSPSRVRFEVPKKLRTWFLAKGAASIPSPGPRQHRGFLLPNPLAARGALCSPSEFFRQEECDQAVLRFVAPSRRGATCTRGAATSQAPA
jgi:hypothetical protein